MGICYLANPLHQQIRTVFHEISHWVESSETLSSQVSHTAGHDHGSHQEHDHNPHHHQEHHHQTSPDHQHALLDLMDTLFEASDEEHTENDTVLPLIQWDKHISIPDYSLPQTFPVITFQDTSTLEQKVRIGYGVLFDIPPRYLFPSC